MQVGGDFASTAAQCTHRWLLLAHAPGNALALKLLLVVNELSIDEDSMSIRWQGKELSLTLTEFWLIESMARHPGHVKTYENMMQITRQSYVGRNTINGYIRRIRNKFKEIDPDFKHIQTVFGVGYKWNIGEV